MATVFADDHASLESSLPAAPIKEHESVADVVEDDFMDCSTEDEDLPNEMQLVGGAVEVASTSGNNDEHAGVLSRSLSQEEAHVQIQCVLQRIEQSKLAVPELKDEVTSLSADHGRVSDEQIEQRVSSSLKRARNLGEDLVEDLLALDKLTGLLHEDRSSRKAAVASINSLLDDVDACKSNIVKLQNTVREAYKAQKLKEEAESTAKDSARETQCKHAPSAPAASASTRVNPGVIALPSADIWTDMQVSVDFQIRQQRGGYALLAAIPSLHRDTLNVKVNKQTQELTVSGVCLPTSRQAEQMRKHVVGSIAKARPQQFSHVNAQVGDAVAQAYRELGEGKFGSFSKTIRLPMDVDVARVNAGFEDGILSIGFTKSVRRGNPAMTARPHYRHGPHYRSGLSMFDW